MGVHEAHLSMKALTIYVSTVILVLLVGVLYELDIKAISSLLIFVTAIFLIATEILSRSTAALLGAILVFSFVIAYSSAMHGDAGELIAHYVHEIEMNTILTLFGIMVVASMGLRTGLFYYIGMKVAKVSRGDPIRLFFILAVFTYFLNVVLIAVATIVVVVSLTLAICDILKIDPRPYVLMEIFIVNVGASATMISAVPNIIIAEKVEEVTFSFFVVNLLPFTALFFIISLWLLYKISRPSPEIDLKRAMAILEIDEWLFVKDKKQFYIAAVSIVGLIVGFMVSPYLMVVSLLFAIIALTFYSSPDELLKDVDWDTLLFFIGFYVVVAFLKDAGVLALVAEMLINVAGGQPVILILLLFIISVLISGFVDNIPYVLVLIPIAEEILKQPGFVEYSTVFWILLILACNIGGALNPYSAPQNLLALSLARKANYSIDSKSYYKVSIKWIFVGSLMAVMYGLAIIYAPTIIKALGYTTFMVIVTVIVLSVVLLIVNKLIGFRYLWIMIREGFSLIWNQIKALLKRIKKALQK